MVSYKAHCKVVLIFCKIFIITKNPHNLNLCNTPLIQCFSVFCVLTDGKFDTEYFSLEMNRQKGFRIMGLEHITMSFSGPSQNLIKRFYALSDRMTRNESKKIIFLSLRSILNGLPDTFMESKHQSSI